METFFFDLACGPTVAAGAEPHCSGSYYEVWTVRVSADFVYGAIYVNGRPSWDLFGVQLRYEYSRSRYRRSFTVG
jgi:hypothetical protein